MRRIGNGRLAAAIVGVLAAFVSLAATAGAHTWSLATDMPASANGTVAPPNPFADSYANSGVWAVGFGGGGTYTPGPGYTGLTAFTVAGASEWAESAGGVPGAESWNSPAYGGYPYVGVNHTESTVFLWPAGGVFMHPGPESLGEGSRGAVRWTSPITGTVKIQASFTRLDCGGGDGVDYSVERQASGSSTVTHLAGQPVVECGSGTYESAGASVTKGDSYYFSVGDGGVNEYFYDTTGVAVQITDGAAEPLSITAPASQTVVYRHAIGASTVSGKDADSDAVTFTAANLPAGLSLNSTTGAVSGTPTVPAGRYTTTFSASDGHGETVTAPWTLTVERANCAIVNKPALVASAAKAALSAKLIEAGTKLGLAAKEVQFGLRSVSTGGGIGPFITKTTSTGTAKATVKVPADVYVAGAQFVGDGYYNPCANTAPEVVTLYPATFTASGGGSILVAKKTATFGMIAVAGAEPGGEMLMYTPAGELAIGSMATATISKPTSTSAVVSGTGLWNGTEAEYSITASDPGSGADTLSVTVSSAGTTLWSTGGAQAVKGGDLKVH